MGGRRSRFAYSALAVGGDAWNTPAAYGTVNVFGVLGGDSAALLRCTVSLQRTSSGSLDARNVFRTERSGPGFVRSAGVHACQTSYQRRFAASRCEAN